MSRFLPKFLQDLYDDYQNVKKQLQETTFAMQILRQKCEESRYQLNNEYMNLKSEYEITREHNRELRRTVGILRKEVGIFREESDEIRGNLAELSRKIDAAADDRNAIRERSEDRLSVLSKSSDIMTQRVDELHERYLQVETDGRIMRDQLAETRENVVTDSRQMITNLEEELDVLRDRFEFDTPLRRLDYYIDCLEKGKDLKSIVFKPYVMIDNNVSNQKGSLIGKYINENITNEKFNRFLDLLQTNQTIETFIMNNEILIKFFNDINILRKLNNFIGQSKTIKNLQLFNIEYINIDYFQEFLATIFRNESIMKLYITPVPFEKTGFRAQININQNTFDVFNRNTTLKILSSQISLPNDNNIWQICQRKGIIYF